MLTFQFPPLPGVFYSEQDWMPQRGNAEVHGRQIFLRFALREVQWRGLGWKQGPRTWAHLPCQPWFLHLFQIPVVRHPHAKVGSLGYQVLSATCPSTVLSLPYWPHRHPSGDLSVTPELFCSLLTYPSRSHQLCDSSFPSSLTSTANRASTRNVLSSSVSVELVVRVISTLSTVPLSNLFPSLFPTLLIFMAFFFMAVISEWKQKYSSF